MATYSKSSPYYTTEYPSGYLDVINFHPKENLYFV